MKIAVLGVWHQGAVVSACLADLGHTVRGADEGAALIAGLQQGRAAVAEPELDDIIGRNEAAGRLAYSTDLAWALDGAELAYICIDTPVDERDESDLSSILRAVDAVAAHAPDGMTLAVSAQVPIGTCGRIAATLAERRPAAGIDLAYVPEFLQLGKAVQTFREADRFVIGTDSDRAAERLTALYEPLGRPLYRTDVRSAEMAKHTSNAFLATSISFINYIADLCEHTGADVTDVSAILKLDPRMGPRAYLGAGLGYAGGTLAREIVTLQHVANASGVDTSLMAAVERVNNARIPALAARIQRECGDLTGKRVAVLGLTYKAGTSTLRRSPGLALIELLQAAGAKVAAYDPMARMSELAEAPPFEMAGSPETAAAGATALVLVAPWAGIRDFDFTACARAMATPVLFDAGNFLPADQATKAGLRYVGVGRRLA